jgi:hypothetical protein
MLLLLLLKRRLLHRLLMLMLTRSRGCSSGGAISGNRGELHLSLCCCASLSYQHLMQQRGMHRRTML